MKVQCEYCDSYVDIDDKMTCPNCGASLGQAYQKAKAEEEKAQAEAARAQAAEEAEAEAEEKLDDTLSLIKGVAGGLLAGTLLGGRQSHGRTMDRPPMQDHGGLFGNNKGPGVSKRPGGPGGMGPGVNKRPGGPGGMGPGGGRRSGGPGGMGRGGMGRSGGPR